MQVNPNKQLVTCKTEVLSNVPLPAAVRKVALKKIQDLSVPVVELIYKSDPERSKRVTIANTADAYAVLMKHWDMNKIEYVKQLKILLLTHANKVLGICDLASGTMSKALYDTKYIFSSALLSGASKIILANNNAGGTLQPSKTDITATSLLVYSGKLLGIEVLDHIIFCKEGYYSFVDNKLIKQENG